MAAMATEGKNQIINNGWSQVRGRYQDRKLKRGSRVEMVASVGFWTHFVNSYDFPVHKCETKRRKVMFSMHGICRTLCNPRVLIQKL